jgi:hypothetical protein
MKMRRKLFFTAQNNFCPHFLNVAIDIYKKEQEVSEGTDVLTKFFNNNVGNVTVKARVLKEFL